MYLWLSDMVSLGARLKGEPYDSSEEEVVEMMERRTTILDIYYYPYSTLPRLRILNPADMIDWQGQEACHPLC